MKKYFKRIPVILLLIINFIFYPNFHANLNLRNKELDLSLDKKNKYHTQYTPLPNMGDDVSNTMSDSQERLLGTQVFYEILSTLPLEKNIFIQEYIQNLGDKLVSHSPNIAKHKFKFFVINSDVINAFALPGGYIGINKGLIDLAQNETELASVMAHEIAHVTQRHIARAIQNQDKMQLPYFASLLGALILSAYNPELGQGALAATMAGAEQMNINFTRSNEEEADRVGIQILANSGFNPNGMADFFEKMHKATSNGLFKIPELLRTHPITESRISEATSFAKNYKFKFYKNNPKFYLIKTLFKFENTPNIIELRNAFNKQLKSGFYENKNAARLGIALSYLYSKQPKDKEKAKFLLHNLYNTNPNENIYLSTYAQSLKDNKENSKAEKLLKNHIEIFPNDFAIISQYSDLILNNKNNINSLRFLEKTLNNYIINNNQENHVIYPEAYAILSKVQLNENKKFLATQSQAEFLRKIGNYPAAMYHLNSLIKHGKLKDYQKKIIDVKIKKLRAEYEALNSSS